MDADCPACEGAWHGPIAHLTCAEHGGDPYHVDCYRRVYASGPPACAECGARLGGVRLSARRAPRALLGAARRHGVLLLVGGGATAALALASPALLACVLAWALARPLHGGGPYGLGDAAVLGLILASIARGAAGATLLYYGLYAAWGVAATLAAPERRGRLARALATPMLYFETVTQA